MEYWSDGVLNWLKKMISIFSLPITPLLQHSNTPSIYVSLSPISDESEISARNLYLQGNVAMPLIDLGSLFVAQHSQGFYQLRPCFFGLNHTVYQHIGCRVVGI